VVHYVVRKATATRRALAGIPGRGAASNLGGWPAQDGETTVESTCRTGASCRASATLDSSWGADTCGSGSAVIDRRRSELISSGPSGVPDRDEPVSTYHHLFAWPRLITVPDHWITFTDRYLDALDDVAGHNSAKAPSRQRATDQGRERRTGNLAGWHLTLLDRLFGGSAEDRLDRLAAHPALGGPDLAYFQAQLSRHRGDPATARRLVGDALDRLPGHRDYLTLAKQIDAPLPDRTREVASSRVERLMGDS